MDPHRAFPGLEGLGVGRQTERKRLTMPLYEHVYMARQDVTAPQVETLTEQLKSLIAAQGGSVSKVEAWGLKSLAFRIKKNRKAHFTLMNIDAPPSAIAELERQLGLNEDVIRFITLRVDAHETGPSAMLRKREDGDREERGGRGPRGDRSDRPDRGDRSDRGDRPDRPPRRPRDDAQAGAL
jgi:small subunit ribosomal protein S6